MTQAVTEQPNTAATQAPQPLPQRWLTSSIVWYQRLRDGRPSPCRFFPSCSAYALEAVEVHGWRRGSWLAVKRLARCRPLGPSGFDPVPEPTSSHHECTHTHPDSSPDHIAGRR